MPHEVSPEAPRPRFPTVVEDKTPSVAARIAMGTILALGFYLGVKKLVTGTVMALSDNPDAWWLSVRGLSAVYGTQAVAVVFGSIIAAAGRERGFGYGMAVGSICGGCFLAYELLAGAPSRDLVLYLQPPVLALLGLVAGVVGARIWSMAPALDIPLPNPSKLSSIQLATESATASVKPTLWGRILAGACIMVCGTAGADYVRHYLQNHSGGMLHVQNLGQGEFMTWQLATFAMLMGGIAAGAGTGAGLRHGLLAGAIGGIGVLGICLKQGQALPPVDYWLTHIDLGDLPLSAPTVWIAIAGSVLLVGVVGGWLGGDFGPPTRSLMHAETPAYRRGLKSFQQRAACE